MAVLESLAGQTTTLDAYFGADTYTVQFQAIVPTGVSARTSRSISMAQWSPIPSARDIERTIDRHDQFEHRNRDLGGVIRLAPFECAAGPSA